MFGALINFALAALRGAFVLCGGGAVAILSFIAAKVPANHEMLLSTLTLFTTGGVLAVLNTGVCYIAQMCHSKDIDAQWVAYIRSKPRQKSAWKIWGVGLQLFAIALFITSISLFIVGCLSAKDAFAGQQEQTEVLCSRVVDGDTLVMDVKGLQARVRVLWIDTPEKGEPGAKEATAWVREQCEGKMLRLEFEPGHVDRYGRNLAHVYLPDGRWLAAELVQRGMAEVFMAPDGAEEKLRTNGVP